jgi:hypothetical protein
MCLFKGLFNITVISEYITFFSAVLLLGKKTGHWRFFILFLFAIIAAETGGWFASARLGVADNSWIFNVLLCINVCFCVWILSLADPMVRIRKSMRVFFFVIAVYTLGNFIFFQGLSLYNSYTEIVYDIMLGIISCYLFYETLKESKYRNLLQYEYFWFANGLLVFSLSSAVLSSSRPQFWAYQLHTGTPLFGYLNDTVNVLLYSCLIIAFICRKINSKSLS